jgi:hypothetical protein
MNQKIKVLYVITKSVWGGASRKLNRVGRSTASAGILASRKSRVRALKNARQFAEEANSLALLKTLRF